MRLQWDPVGSPTSAGSSWHDLAPWHGRALGTQSLGFGPVFAEIVARPPARPSGRHHAPPRPSPPGWHGVSLPPCAAAGRFLLRLRIAAALTQRLRIRPRFGATFGQRHDVIADDRQDATTLRSTRPAERLGGEELLSQPLQLAPFDTRHGRAPGRPTMRFAAATRHQHAAARFATELHHSLPSSSSTNTTISSRPIRPLGP